MGIEFDQISAASKRLLHELIVELEHRHDFISAPHNLSLMHA